MVRSGRRVNFPLEFLDSGDNVIEFGCRSHDHSGHPVVIPPQGIDHFWGRAEGERAGDGGFEVKIWTVAARLQSLTSGRRRNDGARRVGPGAVVLRGAQTTAVARG